MKRSKIRVPVSGFLSPCLYRDSSWRWHHRAHSPLQSLTHLVGHQPSPWIALPLPDVYTRCECPSLNVSIAVILTNLMAIWHAILVDYHFLIVVLSSYKTTSVSAPNIPIVWTDDYPLLAREPGQDSPCGVRNDICDFFEPSISLRPWTPCVTSVCLPSVTTESYNGYLKRLSSDSLSRAATFLKSRVFFLARSVLRSCLFRGSRASFKVFYVWHVFTSFVMMHRYLHRSIWLTTGRWLTSTTSMYFTTSSKMALCKFLNRD